MQIDVAYIGVALTFLLIGTFIGILIGRRLGVLGFLRTALQVKNPEMWELVHYYVVDESETKRHRKPNAAPGTDTGKRTAAR